jgi:hypothetical protein
VGHFALGMTRASSTTKTHSNNAKDDERWGTTKKSNSNKECQNGNKQFNMGVKKTC